MKRIKIFVKLREDDFSCFAVLCLSVLNPLLAREVLIASISKVGYYSNGKIPLKWNKNFKMHNSHSLSPKLADVKRRLNRIPSGESIWMEISLKERQITEEPMKVKI